MTLIDRTGTFRGDIVDAGVSLTKNDYPQYVAKLLAEAYWDEEEQKWVSWKEVEENEAIAYLILFGSTGETLTCEQVKKVTGWDGVAFTDLNNIDATKISLQFRIADNTYKGKTTQQVVWIDTYDATPGGAGIRKLDADALKQLDAKYKQTLAITAKKAAPVKAKSKKAVTKETTPPVKKTTKPPAIPRPTVAKPTADAIGKCTMQEGWDEICESLSPGVTSEQTETVWMDTIAKVAEGVLIEDITEEQWFQIKVTVKDEICIPF